MRHYVTCSALPRIFKCPASAIYPYAKSDGDGSKVGSAGHAVMEWRALHADEPDCYEKSMAEFDGAAKKFSLDPIDTAVLAKTMRGFKYVPPAGCYAESSFAMDTDLNVKMVPKEDAQPGNYRIADECKIAGTMDLCFWEGSTLWVPDYKFGQDRWVTPIDSNPQIWTLAYMAGSFFKAERVMPAVIFVRPGHEQGVWETPEQGPFRMDEGPMLRFQVKLQERMRQLDELRAAYAGGSDLADACVHGTHCQFCPGISWCPNYLRLVRKVMDSPNFQQGKKKQEPLQPEEAVELANKLASWERAARNARELLVGYVGEFGAVDTGSGLHWGAVEETEEAIVTSRQMFDIVYRSFGDSAFEIFKCSKSAVYDACRDVALKEGKPITEINRRVIGELKESNCVQQKKLVEHKLFRPDIEKVQPKKGSD